MNSRIGKTRSNRFVHVFSGFNILVDIASLLQSFSCCSSLCGSFTSCQVYQTQPTHLLPTRLESAKKREKQRVRLLCHLLQWIVEAHQFTSVNQVGKPYGVPKHFDVHPGLRTSTWGLTNLWWHINHQGGATTRAAEDVDIIFPCVQGQIHSRPSVTGQ